MGLYLEGALKLLQFVETRRPTGRRFGPDADARWSSFRGDLETVDRIELMIRDADAEWPGGFGARNVYALQGVAESNSRISALMRDLDASDWFADPDLKQVTALSGGTNAAGGQEANANLFELTVKVTTPAAEGQPQ